MTLNQLFSLAQGSIEVHFVTDYGHVLSMLYDVVLIDHKDRTLAHPPVDVMDAIIVGELHVTVG